MHILVNGAPLEIATQTLAEALEELGFGAAKVATAVNGTFVPASMRQSHTLNAGDQIEVLAPMQGG